MSKVLYERDNRIGRITLNRPEVMNAIDDDVPKELAAAVQEADRDPNVHVIILSGNGKAFCGGYDLNVYAASEGPNNVYQGAHWDPLQDLTLCGIIPSSSCHCGAVKSRSCVKFMAMP